MDPLYYTRILTGITIFSTSVQIYVIYLINYKTPASTREYCYFLYLFAAADLTFTFFLDIMLAPGQVGGLFASNLQGLARYFSPNGQRILLAITIHAGALLIIIQDYCLIYRFTVIWNRTAHRLFMTIPAKIGLNLFGHSIALSLSVQCYFATMDENTLFRRIKLESLEIQSNTTGEFFVWFDMQSTINLAFFCSMFVGFLISEVLSIVLVYTILTMLKKNSKSFSKNTYRLHRQFTILLAVQLTLPVLLILFPVALTLALGLFGYFFGQRGTQIGYITFSTYAFFNSAFTIFFVTPYREDFKSKLRFLKLEKFLCGFLRARLTNKTPVSHMSSSNTNNLSFGPNTSNQAANSVSRNDGPREAFN